MDINSKLHKENEDRVAEEYLSSLSDLTCNSKPLINMLTMLAEENIEYASVIVRVVEDHIAKVLPDIKLPILYLIDSIVKNVKSTYVQLFSQCIVNIFCGVFETVNEKVRERMYALRQTWNEVFSAQKLYTLDVKVKRLDGNWPITAQHSQPAIHVNPNFLKTVNVNLAPNQAIQALPSDTSMEEMLHAKTRKLLELKKQKLELELEATKKRLEEQEKQLGTSDNVLSPVDAHILAPPAVMPQIMPNNIVTPNIVTHQSSTIRSSIYQNAYRNTRPNLISGPNNLQAQVYPAGLNNVGKPKVHPVNPALINTIRHRDPRLARQNQQGLQQHGNRGIQIQPPSNYSQHNEDSKNTEKTSSYRNKESHKTRRASSGGSGSESKSPTRHSSSRSGRSSNKSSSSSSRDKDRKRSDKTSSSSSGSSNSSDRRKDGGFNNRNKRVTKCDKDDFDIASNSSTYKRKSSSPASSPKTKEAKRDPRSRNNSSKNRTPSPIIIIGPTKDTDLRSNNEKRIKCSTGHTEKEDIESTVAAKDLDKNKKLVLDTVQKSNKDVDLRQTSTATLLNITPALESTIAKTVVTSSPKVSFKIQKLFNKLEKTTDNLLTASSIITNKKTDTINSKGESQVEKTLKLSSSENGVIKQQMDIDNDEEDVKKRPFSATEVEEPLPKKSKSTKIDALFGSEDVDLRTVIPVILPTQQQETLEEKLIPILKSEENLIHQNVENIDKTEPEVLTNAAEIKSSPNKMSTLDDVRAKLAKAAKFNKSGKYEKSHKELSQRLKLTELNINEDSLEANDEKLRTILAQAQELFEMKSVSQDQYKSLVQTVMSINEKNKLKEAKRKELVNTHKSKIIDEDDAITIRNTARDAILKKRIPKLPKTQTNNNELPLENSLPDSNASNSPRYDEKSDDNNTTKSRYNKEKRPKIAKWNDHDTGNQMNIPPNRPWLSGNANKRHFRSIVPHPPMPPLPNPNLHLPQMPWQMASAMPVPPFGNAMPPMMISKVPPPPQPPASFNIAPAPVQQTSKKPCNSIDNPQENLVRSITIDSCAKEIRIYDEVAIVFMEMDQPREIRFQPGQRSISIDDETFVLHFNDDYTVVTIKGEPHRMKFGFPSRELYIDDQWYEIFFGGSIIPVPIGNNIRHLQAEGPPPKVNIGPLRRDLVIGKITMIVDAHIVIGIFIDAKLQTFNLGEKQHTIQFADNLLTVLLDDVAANVEFGGLPKSYELGGKNHFIRFSALPEDVEPGKIKIQNMRYVNTTPMETVTTETNNSQNVSETIASPNRNQPITTIPNTISESIAIKNDENLSTSNEGIVPVTSSAPIISTDILSKINIDELLQKLVSTGLLTSTTTVSSTNSTVKDEPTKPEIVEEPVEVIRPIDLGKPETIKLRQSAIVATLFSGMQCSSCGVRFPPEQTIKYSQHLDWHFRQNRRERDSTRKAHSRKWYYELSDWAQYEEIEDLEEREKNFFETQLNEIDANDDVSNQRSINSPPPSCPAGANDVDRCCDMCHEKFEQFYNEEHEEWHLRSAIRVEDKIYHPLCYEDYKTALNPPKAEEPLEISFTEEDDNAVDNVIKISGDEEAEKLSVTIADDEEDDDDDVIVLPNEEPSVTEIVDDDEEYVPANVSREEMVVSTDSKGDDKFIETVESDVEIEEPNIPFTDLDTYVEKEPTECDETSQLSFMNVKIKEEPKDEEDDDGFEDVGTVLIRPDDEISVHSSEETQTQTIASTSSPATERRPSTESLTLTGIIEPIENTVSTDINISIDGNLEPDVGHNLSISGPTPAIPLSNLVNKIKINITKNTVSTNSNVSVSSSIITTSSSNTSHNSNSNISSEVNNVNKNSLSHGNISNIQTINTIPVLCGGGATMSTIASVVSSNNSKSVNESSKNGNNTVTSNSSDNSTVLRYPQSVSPTTASQRSSPPIEETIKFDFKPELQNVSLKKTKKVECGVETSGLCSIM